MLRQDVLALIRQIIFRLINEAWDIIAFDTFIYTWFVESFGTGRIECFCTIITIIAEMVLSI